MAVFRYFHPDQTGAFTCWSTMTGARATNYGTRIDYIFASRHLAFNAFTECIVMQEVEGSDHCPVKATLKWKPVACGRCPQLCAKYLPEFTGKQQKLSAFFTKVNKTTQNDASDGKTEEGKLSVGNDETATESKYFSPNPLTLKRSGTSIGSKNNKKLKSDTGANMGQRQGSLLNFFSKKTETNDDKPCNNDSKTPVSVLRSTVVSDTSVVAYAQQKSFSEKGAEGANVIKKQKSQNTAINSWKNLLKGPPPPPNCKGHNEPCLLRTVKKEDSLNKGRQFWVCNRPEGHKTNPEARCDTFIWVDKKKK